MRVPEGALEEHQMKASQPTPAAAPDAHGDVHPRHLLGSCASGSESDKGRLSHGVVGDSWTALCGAKPGSRSAGWAEYDDAEVTCKRCLAKMK